MSAVFKYTNQIVLRAIVPCGVSLSRLMLHMRVKVHSPTSSPGRRSQGRLTESVGATHTSILLTVIAHVQQLQSDIVHG